jgi:hypothetical protein
MYPIVVLALIFFGYGISCIGNARSRKLAFSVSVLTGIAFTAILLISSRATFGDIRQAAHYIRDEVRPDVQVFSTERTKTEFWSGRHVDQYKRSRIRPGVYVALQNIYCDYELEMKYLKQKYEVTALYHKQAIVVPVFCDDMYMKPVKRKDGTTGWRGTANHLISPRKQFGRQKFVTTVILIGSAKGEKGDVEA